MTKNDKKKFKPFLDTQKNSKKGSQIQCHKKSLQLKWKKNKKKIQKGVLKLSLNSDDTGLSYNRPHKGPTTHPPEKLATSNYYYI